MPIIALVRSTYVTGTWQCILTYVAVAALINDFCTIQSLSVIPTSWICHYFFVMKIEKGIVFEMVKPIMASYMLSFCCSCHSNERLFLKDFVHCVPGTSGGRLSRWLQPDSYVDPARCEVLYSRDDMKCGWPAIVTVITKDQYGDVVHVPNLKVSRSQ
jgi:hypothetical protein